MKYLTIIIFVLVSCKKEIPSVEVRKEEAKLINLIESSNKENLEDYIDKIDVVKLKGGIKLVGINKVVCYGSRYYVLDKKTSSLLVYDNKGNYLVKIGERGGGPGEYKKIKDFEIDKKNEQVLILSNYDKALYKFTLNGEFIERITFDFFLNGGFVIDDDTYVFMSGIQSPTFHQLLTTDRKGNIIGNSFPFPKDLSGNSYDYTGGLHKQGKTNYFTEPTSSLIYKIQDSIAPMYQFNFGKNTWKENDRYDLHKFDKKDDRFQISYLQNFYCDTDRVLAFQFATGRFSRIGYYFKKTDKVIAEPFNLKKTFLYRALFLPIGVDENKFISSIDYTFYENILASKEAKEFKEFYPKLNEKLRNDLKDFSENDNPYLLIYEVKDNK